MNKKGYHFMVNNCSKFFSSLMIDGWFCKALPLRDRLADVRLKNCNPKAVNKEISSNYPGLRDKNRFKLQILFNDEETDIYNIEIIF